MEVKNEIKIYSINGKDTVVGEKTNLKVSSVWNRRAFVEIQIGEGEKVIVHYKDLIKAIDNSTNNPD